MLQRPASLLSQSLHPSLCRLRHFDGDGMISGSLGEAGVVDRSRVSVC